MGKTRRGGAGHMTRRQRWGPAVPTFSPFCGDARTSSRSSLWNSCSAECSSAGSRAASSDSEPGSAQCAPIPSSAFGERPVACNAACMGNAHTQRGGGGEAPQGEKRDVRCRRERGRGTEREREEGERGREEGGQGRRLGPTNSAQAYSGHVHPHPCVRCCRRSKCA